MNEKTGIGHVLWTKAAFPSRHSRVNVVRGSGNACLKASHAVDRIFIRG